MKSVFPKGRIKALMRLDDDMGQIAVDVPLIVSKAIELFIEELVQASLEVSETRGGAMLLPGHIKTCVLASERYDFLKDIVEGAPDLPESSGTPS
jgi:hypothetical protein